MAELVDESSAPPTAAYAPSTRRTRLALALALAALAAALVGAVGPAEKVRSTYLWPPQTLPAGQPTRIWYSPLLLIRHVPESLVADLPCSRSQPLPKATHPLIVLASARHPEQAGALAVREVGGELVFTIGQQTFERVRLTNAATGKACTFRLHIGGGRWSLAGGVLAVGRSGELEAMPVVTGLFSGVDLRAPGAPSIEVTTFVHATRTTPRQTLAWVLAALGIVAALLLVTFARRPRHIVRSARTAVVAAWGQAGVVDAVVAVVLLGWWVLSPVFWDDGWVVARERNYAASGGFSTYYDAFGVNLPLDYWLEWLQHWVLQSSTALPLMRLPSLFCLATVWVLCRWAFFRVAGRSGRWSDVAPWALATTFLAIALAWGMTLRPEPVTALLATGVMACAIRFEQRESTGPLAAAAVLVPLALTAHHTGVVALAPVIAIAPRLAGWVRSAVAPSVTIAIASLASLVVLGFVGSDIGQRLADVQTTRQYGITQSWLDELSRYDLLSTFPFGAPLRRGSVGLMALAIVAYAVRRRRSSREPLDLPIIALAISLILLVLTPSKLPWHFGALTGIAALAVGAETLRFRDDARRISAWRLRPFVAIAAATLVAAWSWGRRDAWNPVDLRTTSWTPGLRAIFSFPELAVVLPLLLLYGAMLFRIARGRRERLPGEPWRVAAWTAPLLATPLIIFTVGVLGADAVRTGTWTATRQSVGALAGRAGCGLADDVLVARLQSTRSLPLYRNGKVTAVPAWVPEAPASGVRRLVLTTSGPGSVASPWFRLPAGGRLGLFVAEAPHASNSLTLEWGSLSQRRVRVQGTSSLDVAGSGIATAPWLLVGESALPRPTSGATFARVRLLGGTFPQAVAVAPVSYSDGVLAQELATGSTLIHPNLLLYFPCAEQPRLADGVVEPPRHLVWFDHPYQPQPYEATSTVWGLQDLYEVSQRTVEDSQNPPSGVLVFDVDLRIAGAQIAPPDRAVEVS